jgi:hypothetical protein
MLSVNTFYQFHLPSILVRKCDKEDFISEILEINKSSSVMAHRLANYRSLSYCYFREKI